MSTQPPTENIQKNDETQKENLTIETNDVELTIEDKKNVMVLNIFIDLLANDEQLNKLKLDLKLEPKHLHLIQKITELLPTIFDDLSDSISKIYEDKVLDSKDIPSLVILMKNSYKKCIDSKELNKQIKGITLEDSIDFIKNVLLILIELGHLKVENKDDVILMIDMCVDLLTSSVDMSYSLFDTLKDCLCL
jgi:superfamily I DNA and/or RNA helicase